MKILIGLMMLLTAVTGFAKEKPYCGKITHITLHTIDGETHYNFGMNYNYSLGGSNSFGWLNMGSKRDREILELVKLAKASNSTFCAEFGMPVDSVISVQ